MLESEVVVKGGFMKTCSRCKSSKPLSEFTKRCASKDGYAAACTSCLKKQKRIDYICEPEKTMIRVKKNHKARRALDPIYRQAWNQWHYAKALKRVPKWVSFTKDILPVCRKLLLGKEGWTIDHIVPLQGKEVSGLHTPKNLQALPLGDNASKGRSFNSDIIALYDI